ncbi:hypothetical protein ACVIRO_006877 [Rhizobium ruizarguesonis]|jgi:hypothetical protein
MPPGYGRGKSILAEQAVIQCLSNFERCTTPILSPYRNYADAVTDHVGEGIVYYPRVLPCRWKSNS